MEIQKEKALGNKMSKHRPISQKMNQQNKEKGTIAKVLHYSSLGLVSTRSHVEINVSEGLSPIIRRCTKEICH